MTDRDDELWEPEDVEAPPRPDPGLASKRPAWVDEETPVTPARPARVPRAPVPGRHEEDGLWEHVLMTGGIVAVAAFLAAVMLPRTVPVWMITSFAATLAAVVAWVSLSLSGSGPLFAYLAAWGTVLTAWLTAARVVGPWHSMIIFSLVLPVTALMPIGVTVIRRHRDRAGRVADTGIDTMHVRECRYWEGLLAKLDTANVTVKDIILVDGGRQVHCRLNKAADGRRISSTPDADVARRIAVQRRLRPGAVYIEPEPAGQTAADFIIHVRETAGPRLARFLPAENTLLSVNDKFGLGVLDSGREWPLRLREVVVFICGLIGSGKSTLLNVFIAQLSRMPDAAIFMIDLKGGMEARAWLMPWVQGLTERPAIDWLATTREEAKIMLDALWKGGQARAESGRYGRKLRPGIYRIDGADEMCPAIIVICDETAQMTGHFIKEDGISSTQLATRLLQIAETFRAVAISPVVSAVRAVVDTTGNSGIKAMSSVRIGMKVSSVSEGQAIFPDNYPAAQQLARLKDKGMFIPKVDSELAPPVHGYNITDGTPDDDGHPTQDRITPVVLATAGRRPQLEQFVQDAMNEVRIQIGDKDRGAYEARWEVPHIKALLETWKTEAGIRDRPGPAPAGEGDDGEPDDDWARWQAELRDMDPGLDDDEPGYQINASRKRMYELLIKRGPQGYTPGRLGDLLADEGLEVHRGTVMRWLKDASEKGYLYRVGKPQSGKARYVWRLPEGAEFDIPGWR